MDHPTRSMHIIKTKKYLLCYLFDEMHRHALVLMPSDQAKEVLPEHLEHHADVCTIGPTMAEVVEKADDVSTTRMRWIR